MTYPEKRKEHLDYCGLIEQGLALEAPEEIYK